MKNTFSVIGYVVVAISFSAIITFILASAHFTGNFPWEHSIDERVRHFKINSVLLAQEREIVVHLPPGYDSTRKYPVMYVLDGGSFDKDIADKFDILSMAGVTPKTIVVGIPNMTAENRILNLVPPFMLTNPEDPDSPSGGANDFLAFMEKELFPFIEDHVAASDDRLLAGNSRGGLLVMYSLLYNPNLFEARFCFSTPYWRQNSILVTKVSAFLNSNDSLKTFLYMSAGRNETENIKKGLIDMTAILKSQAPSGLTWYTDVTENADHQNNATRSSPVGIARWSEYVDRKH